jgi:hypothetical protein
MAGRAALTAYYETSIDRMGLAIGTGGLMGGAIATALMILAGPASVLALAAALVVGSILTALAITALAVVPWALLHLAGRRGPVSAALLGAAIGFLLFLGGQTYGYGAFTMPIMDAGTLTYRWVSAALTSAVMAAIAAGVGVAMWRVAYRRVL